MDCQISIAFVAGSIGSFLPYLIYFVVLRLTRKEGGDYQAKGEKKISFGSDDWAWGRRGWRNDGPEKSCYLHTGTGLTAAAAAAAAVTAALTPTLLSYPVTNPGCNISCNEKGVGVLLFAGRQAGRLHSITTDCRGLVFRARPSVAPKTAIQYKMVGPFGSKLGTSDRSRQMVSEAKRSGLRGRVRQPNSQTARLTILVGSYETGFGAPGTCFVAHIPGMLLAGNSRYQAQGTRTASSVGQVGQVGQVGLGIAAIFVFSSGSSIFVSKQTASILAMMPY